MAELPDSPAAVAPCAECRGSQPRKGMPLDCDKHWVCRDCIQIRADRVSSDIFRCTICPGTGIQSRDSSTMDAEEKENVWIFVDDSNIWIEGKKLRAKMGKLKCVEDPRARIDIGYLTDFVAMKTRKVVKGTLYGSEPPAIDTVWDKIRKKGWTVPDPKRRSIVTGKEKKVDAQLVADVTELACRGNPETKPGTIIIISGDADATPAIEKVLKYQPWKVEVLMWESAISSDLKHYVKNNHRKYPDLDKRFQVKFLDEHLDSLMYTNFQFQPDPHKHKEMMEWGVVLTLKPDAFHGTRGYPTRHFNSILTNLTQWPFQHYRMLDEAGEKTNKLVIVFRPFKGESFDLASLIRILQEDKARMAVLHAESVRTFKQMLEEPKYYEAKNYSLFKSGFCLQNLYSDADAILPVDTAEEDSEGGWQTQGRKPMKNKRMYSQHCAFKFNCRNGTSCRYTHTREESEYFKKNGGKGNPQRKTFLCKHFSEAQCKHSAAQDCEFAHGEEDAWCLICCDSGHLTRQCKDYQP